jgi:hypothetical protein
VSVRANVGWLRFVLWRCTHGRQLLLLTGTILLFSIEPFIASMLNIAFLAADCLNMMVKFPHLETPTK